ncbi:Fe(3+)-hydroxamate ABC transporter substrate-binding protein FhuD [Erwiniaceae bacterium BAC15a-03b]|uniref:Fe(3+)-hydroxamate ABC transporter substrate-binding protein FhuD n=1 Tax=Winslowiella arboricola TaxID=2978220 RepID=A0A9J6Q1V4_9GAMM|nr:Fe(3+)-hydroxamate ABC transporter substrate-binding protein FhuD [Winslowiella arboricola]MCU5775364.1 Fe(3+)-hydroxamate ABC transporter substrate-binding protein FhuD [Winslowiella arboricola]MCU5780239.1 Fe(3+)-hydroxamate ABC transporter substrate-binding protein FhuD [Winslowiella arboricola]
MTIAENMAGRRQFLKWMALSPLIFSSVTRANDLDLSRIIVLEWRPVELLMALGVTPLAIADIPNYKRWLVEPALPDTVLDVGLRTEPNLEMILRLKPSLILRSNGYGPTADALAPIAPLWGGDFTDGKTRALELMRRDITRLGVRLNRQQQAAEHLQLIDDRFSHYRQTLAAFADQPLLIFSFLDSRRVIVFGHNSLFADALSQLGLQNGWHGASSFWGSTIVGIETLAQVKNVRAIGLTHGEDDPLRQIAQSPLWRSIPFVRQQKLHLIQAVWFYGASFSVLRFCQLLEQTLLEKA